MSEKTNISWTESTWPVIVGCTRVSHGCENCYAERLTATRLRHNPVYKGLATFEDGEAFWNHEVRFNEKVLEDPLRWRRPRRIFVCQMSDLFHELVPFTWLERIFTVMRKCQHHTFQVLTKRPERMIEFMQHVIRTATQSEKATLRDLTPLPNVWLGVSVENQGTANERIPLLLQCPAAIRWVSYEPALGPVNFRDIEHKDYLKRGIGVMREPHGLDWIVAGGESGPRARHCDLKWFRDVRQACADAGVPFFMKQMGNFPESHTKERPPFSELFEENGDSAGMWALLDRGAHSDMNEFPPDLRVREYPEAQTSQKAR